MICPKCGEEAHGQFCSSCGAPLNKERNDWSRVWGYLRDSVDVNTGFLLTVRLLLFSPGTTIRQFLDGEVGIISNPMKVLIITGTIATFITANFWGITEVPGWLDSLEFPDKEGYFNYSAKYFSFFSLDGLPVFALFSLMFFRKTGYNYIEHFLLNIYILSGQFLIVIVLLPGWIFFPFLSNLIYGPANYLYNVWALAGIFGYGNFKWIRAVLACSIPLIFMPIVNYFLYRIAPKNFWRFLGLVFS